MSENIKQFLEADARRAQGDWYECSHSDERGYVGYGTGYVCGATNPPTPNKADATFIAAASRIAPDIRQLLDAFEQVCEALESCKSYKVYIGEQLADNEQFFDEKMVDAALTAAAPYRKMMGGV